jgi:hypothetical protein
VVTNANPQWDEAAVERWVKERYRALVAEVTAILEVETGLREAMIPAQPNSLIADLAAALDLDTGLAAIGPIPGGAEGGPESTPQNRPQRVFNVRELIDALSVVSPAARLSLREPVRRFAQGLALVDDLALARDRGRALALDFAKAYETGRGSVKAHTWGSLQSGALGDACARAPGFYHALDRALDRAGALEFVLADDPYLLFALARHRKRADHLARADPARAGDLDLVALRFVSEFPCARDFARDLGHALNRLNLARDYTLRYVRYLAFDLVRGLAGVDALGGPHGRLAAPRRTDPELLLDGSIGAQLIQSHELEQLIDTFRNFAGADLQELDLTGVPLDGVRWSDSTRWPDRWVKQIHDESVAIGDGTYEIRPGTTTTDFAPPSL